MISLFKTFRTKTFSAIIFVALTMLLHLTSFGAAGDVDASFNPTLGSVPSGTISRTVVQPDGKILIAGEFNLVNGVPKTNLARLNADGSLDTTFNPPVIRSSGAGYPIQALALQADGKIVISGQFNVPRVGVARLNADGSPDTAFNSNAAISNVWYGDDMKITADGKIVVYVVKIFTSSIRNYLVRLNSDGTIDLEREVNTSRFNVQADGKIIVTSSVSPNSVSRLNVDMTPDNSFTPVFANDGIQEVIIQPDGKILIGGNFTEINGSPLIRTARINPNGSIDTSFNINSFGANAVVYALVYLPSGKILVGGDFSSYHTTLKSRVALLNADGSLDTSFTPPTNFLHLYDLAVQSDGKFIAVGSALNESSSAIIRLNADGSRDMSFQTTIGNFGHGRRVMVQPDGKILVGGGFNNVNGAVRKGLVRLNADGTLDAGFNQNVLSFFGYAFDIFSDGKILVVDSSTVIRRLNSDGTTDVTYTNNTFDPVYDVKTLPDGKALAAKGTKLIRYNTNGTIDGTFNVTVSGSIQKIVLQPDGKILVGGEFNFVNDTPRGRIARLNADGTLDTSFNPPGGASGNSVFEIALQSDGKVIIAGEFTGVNFDTNRRYIARLNADGTLDTSFTATVNAAVYAVKPQPDGKILIGGVFTTVGGSPRLRYARLNSVGALDTGFNVGSGADLSVWDIELQSDNKILMVGDFTTINGTIRTGIVRLLNTPSVSRTLFDYDGDGKADISVFRASENKWYILRSSNGLLQQIFAIAGDIPVPADFDGDGKTDFAIFRPSSGDWWSLSSINNAQVYAHWGASGDIPRPSDFDGDGRADYVVFRPSNNFWYRISSGNGATSNSAFGLAGDKPVTGDFDGDGKSDVAIFRPSTGDWWWQSSVDNVQRATRWGISTDIPAPADFDGDGKTDFCVYRPSTGVWYIINSSNGSFTILNFGISEDKPVPADYDGDGKADIAVFRPSTGTWYLQRSTAGFTALQFGISTDIPTPNAFVP